MKSQGGINSEVITDTGYPGNLSSNPGGGCLHFP